ncbi:dienelactone hydrolase family protein [Terriglobus albidus]|uniref:dienelactone hydrolase family protein n=1 Tax=Terriglobus albidus TaxID=1592106 RepID=UPI0021DF55A8|nr:alpha/beta hydrolase [Terriglobus albidus]
MSDPRDERQDNGLPGGGVGRKDDVSGSGVYPASGPLPSGNAELKEQAAWGQGKHRAATYEDHGTSESSHNRRSVEEAYGQGKQSRQMLNVRIPVAGVALEGELAIPADLNGIVLFAHGSGSSRHSPRNRFVAEVLQRAGIATFLFDLLTEEEESSDRETGHLRFNIDLLAKRLVQATSWISQAPRIKEVKLGYFGASTGAAAALAAASEAPGEVAAVVSRGGRPDLAGPALSKVYTPTLLLVGGEDTTVLKLNHKVLEQLRGEKRLQVIPGATHLFEEPGTLEEAALVSKQWFEWYLGRRTNKIRAA